MSVSFVSSVLIVVLISLNLLPIVVINTHKTTKAVVAIALRHAARVGAAGKVPGRIPRIAFHGRSDGKDSYMVDCLARITGRERPLVIHGLRSISPRPVRLSLLPVYHIILIRIRFEIKRHHSIVRLPAMESFVSAQCIVLEVLKQAVVSTSLLQLLLR